MLIFDLIDYANLILGFFALAAGFGYSIPAAFGVPVWLCIVISLALGSAAEEVANKIMYTRYVQEKPVRKLCVFLAFLFVS